MSHGWKGLDIRNKSYVEKNPFEVWKLVKLEFKVQGAKHEKAKFLNLANVQALLF
jgi:hypothetical protein